MHPETQETSRSRSCSNPFLQIDFDRRILNVNVVRVHAFCSCDWDSREDFLEAHQSWEYHHYQRQKVSTRRRSLQTFFSTQAFRYLSCSFNQTRYRASKSMHSSAELLRIDLTTHISSLATPPTSFIDSSSTRWHGRLIVLLDEKKRRVEHHEFRKCDVMTHVRSDSLKNCSTWTWESEDTGQRTPRDLVTWLDRSLWTRYEDGNPPLCWTRRILLNSIPPLSRPAYCHAPFAIFLCLKFRWWVKSFGAIVAWGKKRTFRILSM